MQIGGDMSRLSAVMIVLLFAGTAHAQSKGSKGIRLWNLTSATITGFQLSPAGKEQWSSNLTLADRDKEVDHDERLRISGIAPGRYDARVSYGDNRNCLVKNIEIQADAVFSIADKDLVDCNK